MRTNGNKYNVAPKEARTADNVVFHSRHEMEVYLGFAQLLRAGTILKLELQVPYELRTFNDVIVGKYLADFRVTDISGAVSVYDAKGVSTALYKWKRKHCEAEHGIRIIEL